MNLACGIEFRLPRWLKRFVADWREPLGNVEQRMRLAIALAAENVERGDGGPFGAIVVEEASGRLLGAGVNLVTTLDLSIAHAELIALSVAQGSERNWNLRARADVQLVASSEPCAMCFGAIPWSGVSSLVWGAGRDEAEAAGFDEGDKPEAWERCLEARGIGVVGGVLREEAAGVLSRYANTDGEIYHPERE